MKKKRFFSFSNEMNELPLLKHYICSFESMAGRPFEPDLGDVATGPDAKICIILLSNGELACRSDTEEENPTTNPIRHGSEFQLLLRHFPHEPATRIPFIGGRICRDLSKWTFPCQQNVAQIVKKAPGGFLVRVDESPAFLPNSFLGKDLRENSDVLVERVFECEVVSWDGKHPPVVKPTGVFLTFDEWREGRNRDDEQ